jgi:hypothetical protein
MPRTAVLLVVFAPLALLSTDPSPAPAQAPVAGKDDGKKPGIDRTRAGKARLLKAFGGSEEGEEAVMLGLAWLTQTQHQDGGWVFDGNRKADTAPATGLAVLAFLGAGQSHKDGRYKQTVQAGLDWLVNNLDAGNDRTDGHFKGAPDMYGQGIATLALCEAYGMTQDPALKGPAQRAIDYVQRAQGRNGSWGYQYGTQNDTSIVGWQIQALHAAKLAGLTVDDAVIKKAIGFLNFVGGGGQYKPVYGYTSSAGASHATNLTAIGLLCRYYVDGWRREHPGFAEGSRGLLKRTPLPAFTANQFDMYYYYYATQVVRFYGGEEWETWNKGAKRADGTRGGGMPDWLIKLQVRTPTNRGSWDPDRTWIGRDCGRLGTTCLCLLTLEVYYRYSPEDEKKQ